jgi:flagellar biogenesis protein FliO
MDSLRQILAIGFVLGLLWFALWSLRKKAGVRLPERNTPAARTVLQSRGRLTLGPQHSLHLVRIGDRELALAVHPSGIVLLCDLAPCAPPRIPES